MTIYEDVKKEMIHALKTKDDGKKSLLRVLVSDIQRDPNKDYCDKKVMVVIKQTVKILYDNYDKFDKSQDLIDAEYLERVYLPKQTSSEDIIKFLNDLDFSKFKNKMQAIGEVTKNFPEGTVDGNMAKSIIMEMK